jgi:hypothetical protein
VCTKFDIYVFINITTYSDFLSESRGETEQTAIIANF